ncbi:MAG: hypothetical protein WDZ82_00940 [Candidatus Paceibacterota bacterium]
MRQIGVVLFIIALLVVIGGLIYWSVSSTPASQDAQIVSFEVEESDLVVETRGDVASVSIYGVVNDTNATGTATTSEDILIGEATQTETETAEGVTQWRLQIPSAPLPLMAVYAQAYGEDGEELDRESLSQTGPSEIRNELWGGVGQTNLTLSVGETGSVGEAELTLEEIVDDARPEGGLTARVTLAPEDEEAQEVTLSTDDEQETVGMYILQILEVSPEMSDGTKISEEDYEIRFLVFREAKL